MTPRPPILDVDTNVNVPLLVVRNTLGNATVPPPSTRDTLPHSEGRVA